MVSLLSIFVLSLQTASASSHPHTFVCPAASHQEVVMKIHFVRSGGFGGAATRVEGDVTFDDHGAQVTSEKLGYQRPLAASEAEMLRCAAEPQPKSKNNPAKGASMPDGFQYDISTETDDGKVHHLASLADTANTSSRTPEDEELVKWIQQESGRIWEYKINHR
jgi:hypothetical protein